MQAQFPPFTQEPLEVNLLNIELIIKRGSIVIGELWLARQIEINNNNRFTKHKPSNGLARSRLYESEHPIIAAFYELKSWKLLLKNHSQTEAPEAVYHLIHLFSMLFEVKNCLGVEGVLEKLREPSEYLGAWFEIFIARQLLRYGSRISFNPPQQNGGKKNPDLYVTPRTGNPYWAECKHLVGPTEQAAKDKKFRLQIFEKVNRIFTKKSLNASLFIRANDEVNPCDVDDLVKDIFKACELLEIQPDQAVSGQVLGDRYFFRLSMLCSAGQAIPTASTYELNADFPDSQLGIFQSSGGKDGELVNPKIIGICYPQERDQVGYNRLLRGFRAAAKQIPQDGPGAIFLGVIAPSAMAISDDLGHVAQKIKRQLDGEFNRRINFATILTFEIVRTNVGILEEVAAGQYNHNNPKSPI